MLIDFTIVKCYYYIDIAKTVVIKLNIIASLEDNLRLMLASIRYKYP